MGAHVRAAHGPRRDVAELLAPFVAAHAEAARAHASTGIVRLRPALELAQAAAAKKS